MLNVIPITDFSSSELDVYARLSENDLLSKHEPEKGIFIAESPNVIERALNAGYEAISFLIETNELARTPFPLCEMPLEDTSNNINVNTRIFTRSEIATVPIYTASYEVLSQLTGFQLTRGMLCAMKRPALPTVEEICKL